MTPIGAGLHEPSLICSPFVIFRFGTVAQKLMKLFVDVADATWPASGWSWPSFAKPVAMTELRRVSELWASPPAAPLPVAELSPAAVDAVLDA